MPAFSQLSSSCVFIVLLLGSACVETFDGDGLPAEEDRSQAGFNRVSARGALNVEVTQAAAFAIRVNIDSNLIRRVSTSVSDTTLEIEVDGGNLGESLGGPHVLVSMPTLRDLELNGSGRLSAQGFDADEDEDVSVELAGSGEVSWSGRAQALDAVLSGSGSLVLDGEAASIDLYLAGGGELDARSLSARRGTIELAGSGSITASVDGRVDATVSGTGEVELYGDVVRGTWEESGGGTISGP